MLDREIKSSTEKSIIEKAKQQLILRLHTISKAVEILEDMDAELISSVGRVFVSEVYPQVLHIERKQNTATIKLQLLSLHPRVTLL